MSPQRFYFADAADQGAPRDITANRAAENVLHFRILVDPKNPNTDSQSADVVVRNRLAIQFEDYGPDWGNTQTHNNPFRLRWTIPDNMRDGEWHEVSVKLPPPTWQELEDGKTNGTISGLEAYWTYTGAWANFPIGLNCHCPTGENPTLWKEFEWDKVQSLGIQWDWGGSGNEGAPIHPLEAPSIMR